MLILALDCSTARGSLALGRLPADENSPDGRVLLHEQEFPAGRGHGGELFSVLQQAMRAAASAGTSDHALPVTKILVGLGPGSYSGVRQAIAVATGLSLATGAALVGLPSALASEGVDPRLSYHIIGDARRGTFYYTAMTGRRILEGPELIDSAPELLARLALQQEWPVLAAESVPGSLPASVNATPVWPVAARLLEVSASLYQSGVLEPIYLRPPTVTMPRAAMTGLAAKS